MAAAMMLLGMFDRKCEDCGRPFSGFSLNERVAESEVDGLCTDCLKRRTDD